MREYSSISVSYSPRLALISLNRASLTASLILLYESCMIPDIASHFCLDVRSSFIWTSIIWVFVWYGSSGTMASKNLSLCSPLSLTALLLLLWYVM